MTDHIPLDRRVCITLMCAGVLDPDGTHARCMGPCCSSWESCEYNIKYHELELKKQVKSGKPKKVKSKPSGISRGAGSLRTQELK